MPKITGLGYTRRDKVFAQFELDGSFYTFKESHTSKNKLYKVGIYQDGKKIFKIDMDREQINRIKENKGIAGMEFLNEEGFKSWIEENYLNREFRPTDFREHFSSWFLYHFKYLDTESNPETEYVSYLMGMIPESLLENFYRENKVDLQKTFRYLEDAYTKKSEERRDTRYRDMLDSIKAQAKQYLNQNGVQYLDEESFKTSINREIVNHNYKKFLENKSNRLANEK